jgi:hypothetical protein
MRPGSERIGLAATYFADDKSKSAEGFSGFALDELLDHRPVGDAIGPLRGRKDPAEGDEVLLRDREGRAFFLPGTGGIALGVHEGEPIDGWAGDHLMVGASIEDADGSPAVPGALHLLSCIGNGVRDGSGALLGVVAGKRGGLAPGHFAPSLIAVEIDDARMADVAPGDRVVVEAVGSGLALPDWPDVGLFNLSPRLLDALPMAEEAGRLVVAVRGVVPARVAGAGLGTDAWIGNLEVTELVTLEGSVSDLCFGDLVAFEGIDARAGRYYRPGHVAIGVVAHGPSPAPGHGPGITILITRPATSLAARVARDATLGSNLRHWSRG